MPTVDRRRLWVAAHVDPAGGPRAGRTAAGLSRAAIAVIGQDDLERCFILETWAQRIPPDRLIDRVFDTQAKWNPAVFGIDATGPQQMFAQMMQKEARERGLRIPLRLTDLKMDKQFSIEMTLQPLVASGRLLRPPLSECRVLKEEWEAFPTGAYRDALDALACAVRLLPSVLPAHLRAMSEQQLRSYLKRTGMANDQIEQRLEQHRVANEQA